MVAYGVECVRAFREQQKRRCVQEFDRMGGTFVNRQVVHILTGQAGLPLLPRSYRALVWHWLTSSPEQSKSLARVVQGVITQWYESFGLTRKEAVEVANALRSAFRSMHPAPCESRARCGGGEPVVGVIDMEDESIRSVEEEVALDPSLGSPGSASVVGDSGVRDVAGFPPVDPSLAQRDIMPIPDILQLGSEQEQLYVRELKMRGGNIVIRYIVLSITGRGDLPLLSEAHRGALMHWRGLQRHHAYLSWGMLKGAIAGWYGARGVPPRHASKVSDALLVFVRSYLDLVEERAEVGLDPESWVRQGVS